MKVQCKEFKDKILAGIKEEVSKLEKKPRLTVIQVGDNPASNKYVGNKLRTCEGVGIETSLVKLDESISEEELVQAIKVFNLGNSNGTIVQLPLPKHINANRVMQHISPMKDVDCLTEVNIGKLHSGVPFVYPCTPLGCIKILEEQLEVDLTGKNVLMLGRSNIVGRPLASMLEQRNATVTLAHSKSNVDYNKYDIIVSAIGQAKAIKVNNPNAILIDVGINFDENGKMCGDFDLDNSVFKYATTTPGGTGQLTCAMVCYNVIDLYKKQGGR